MKTLITNLYGMGRGSVAMVAQNKTADIACQRLNMHELGIYAYDLSYDTPEQKSSRLDGVIASLSGGDTVIFQYPTWNGIDYDEYFLDKISVYPGVRKIIYVHDADSIMFESHSWLVPRQVALLNRADVLILPSERMYERLKQDGLNVEKVVYQRMWDFPCDTRVVIDPPFNHGINFAGDPEKFTFCKEWDSDDVQLSVTCGEESWNGSDKVKILGWFLDDASLLAALRKSGGMGLVWCQESHWTEYMTMNANYKLSTYLAAGLPLIVPDFIAVADEVRKKGLGYVVSSLEEAKETVRRMTEEDYRRMRNNVEAFAPLIRNGHITEKVLSEALWKLMYE